MSKKIPTAEEFLYQEIDYHRYDRLLQKDIIKALKKFAKIHIKAQAEIIVEKVKIIDDPNSYTGNTGSEYLPDRIVSDKSILEAYPSHLIK